MKSDPFSTAKAECSRIFNPSRKGGALLKMLSLLFCLVLSTVSLAADAGYHLIKKLPLGGEGGWDFPTVDSAARRLYLSRGSHVMVVDIDREKLVGDIPDTPGVHG